MHLLLIAFAAFVAVVSAEPPSAPPSQECATAVVKANEAVNHCTPVYSLEHHLFENTETSKALTSVFAKFCNSPPQKCEEILAVHSKEIAQKCNGDEPSRLLFSIFKMAYEMHPTFRKAMCATDENKEFLLAKHASGASDANVLYSPEEIRPGKLLTNLVISEKPERLCTKDMQHLLGTIHYDVQKSKDLSSKIDEQLPELRSKCGSDWVEEMIATGERVATQDSGASLVSLPALSLFASMAVLAIKV